MSHCPVVCIVQSVNFLQCSVETVALQGVMLEDSSGLVYSHLLLGFVKWVLKINVSCDTSCQQLQGTSTLELDFLKTERQLHSSFTQPKDSFIVKDVLYIKPACNTLKLDCGSLRHSRTMIFGSIRLKVAEAEHWK